MRKKVIMITGACGEIGQSMLQSLAAESQFPVLTLDLQPLPAHLSHASIHIQGDILDRALVSRLVSEYEIDTVYHLAALLSTRSEFTPEAAHRVNVEGTLMLLQMATEQSAWRGKPVKFIFPSSIAAYGLPDLETKTTYARVREWEWKYPRTMYGCTQMISSLLKFGIGHIADVTSKMKLWMEEKEYESVDQMRGSMSYLNVDDPAKFDVQTI